MDLTCPKCQRPTEVQGSLAENEHLLSACPTCHVNLILLKPDLSAREAVPPDVDSPTTGPTSPATPSRKQRLARWLSVSTFLINLTIVAALLMGSLYTMRTIYDPYNLDEHVLTPLLLWMNGWTDLHLAAARGEVVEVQRLIAEGAEVDVATGKGRTPLFEAAKRGQGAAVGLLLDHGASPDAADETGKTPLMESTEQGHHRIVQLLVARGASLELTQAGHGNTALHLAAQQNQYWPARHLVAGGAQVDSRNAMRSTPLHLSASQPWHENAAVAAFLIDSRADLEARDNRGFTPLMRAAQHGHLPVFSALTTRNADPNARNHRGQSALYLAAQAGRYQIAKILLDRGADPNARCDCGSTPLHKAVGSGDERLVVLLLERGAAVNAKVRGKTPLQLAAEKQQPAIAGVLKARGGTTYPEIHQHVSRARELSKAKAYAKAAQHYSEALALDPNDAELYYRRGAARMSARQHGPALEDLAQAVELDPSLFDAHVKIAYILSLEQKWDGIIARWDRFLARQPDHAKALYERGHAYFRKGALQHDTAAQTQALADTLRSCHLGYDTGCQTYEDTTGKPAT